MSGPSRLIGLLGALAALAGCQAEERAPAEADAAGERGVAVSEPLPETTGFTATEMGVFDNAWAMEFAPGTDTLFITHVDGRISMRLSDGRVAELGGVPEVEYGGQGGLGDIAFARDYADSHRLFLSWVVRGRGRLRGAVAGTGLVDCEGPDRCSLTQVEVIWRQSPMTTTQGHYAHRLLPSEDGRFVYIASGDRHEQPDAQTTDNNLGKVVRLAVDGSTPSDNPFGNEVWSLGHRNPLGIDFDLQGRLWEVEHGPVGGDELNLVTRGGNYGWPLVSDGAQYDGSAIPAPDTRPDLAAPALSWTPVIAPGDMITYRGDLFHGWRGDLLITGLRSRALVRVRIDGDSAAEVARYPMDDRIRAVAEAPDGALWLIEDGPQGRLLRLFPDDHG